MLLTERISYKPRKNGVYKIEVIEKVNNNHKIHSFNIEKVPGKEESESKGTSSSGL